MVAGGGKFGITGTGKTGIGFGTTGVGETGMGKTGAVGGVILGTPPGTGNTGMGAGNPDFGDPGTGNTGIGFGWTGCAGAVWFKVCPGVFQTMLMLNTVRDSSVRILFLCINSMIVCGCFLPTHSTVWHLNLH